MHYWQHIPFFLAVSQTGRFAGLNACNRAKPHCGSWSVQLFKRFWKGLEFTQAGQVFLVGAQQAEKQLEKKG